MYRHTEKGGADVSVVIGTYGDENFWGPKALSAFDSAREQTVVPRETIWVHSNTLQDARQSGVLQTTGEWVIHLDADDSLDPGYVEGILNGTGDLRQPRTLGVYGDGHEDPEAVFIPSKTDFTQGNWLIIGTGVRRKFFEAAGGWGNEDLYEDWSLWWRCWLMGAEIGQAPNAIYRVKVSPQGRNLPDRRAQIYWFEKIAKELKGRKRAVSV